MYVCVWVCVQEDSHLQGPEEDISCPGAGVTVLVQHLTCMLGTYLRSAGKEENALNLKPSFQTQEQVPNAILIAFLYILNYFNMINNLSFYISIPGFNDIFQSSLSQQRLTYIVIYYI